MYNYATYSCQFIQQPNRPFALDAVVGSMEGNFIRPKFSFIGNPSPNHLTQNKQNQKTNTAIADAPACFAQNPDVSLVCFAIHAQTDSLFKSKTCLTIKNKAMKMQSFFTLVCVLSLSGVQAQVGIGTDNPSSKAVLHLESSDKGLIIPKMTTAQMSAMSLSPVPENGTMVYNTDSNEIYTYYNSLWYSSTPFRKVLWSGTGSKPQIEAAGKHLAVKSVSGNGSVPLGAIMMWSGTTAPAGWALCDGTTVSGYKTPDLRSRFVVGYNPSNAENNDPGNLSTGGTSATTDTKSTDLVTLSVANLPSHNHSYSGSTDWGGSHTHNVNHAMGDVSASWTGNSYWPTHPSHRNNGSWTKVTEAAGYHSHLFNGSTDHTGSATPIDVRPAYYTIAFIMRVQ
jgi:microcystin-dependent protein